MQRLFTRFSRRDRVHEVAEDDHIFAGTAVEMKDDEDDDESDGCASSCYVDVGGGKKQICVRSVSSRHEHDMHKDDDQVLVVSA